MADRIVLSTLVNKTYQRLFTAQESVAGNTSEKPASCGFFIAWSLIALKAAFRRGCVKTALAARYG
jgi:hypothetical protein